MPENQIKNELANLQTKKDVTNEFDNKKYEEMASQIQQDGARLKKKKADADQKELRLKGEIDRLTRLNRDTEITTE